MLDVVFMTKADYPLLAGHELTDLPSVVVTCAYFNLRLHQAFVYHHPLHELKREHSNIT